MSNVGVPRGMGATRLLRRVRCNELPGWAEGRGWPSRNRHPPQVHDFLARPRMACSSKRILEWQDPSKMPYHGWISKPWKMFKLVIRKYQISTNSRMLDPILQNWTIIQLNWRSQTRTNWPRWFLAIVRNFSLPNVSLWRLVNLFMKKIIWSREHINKTQGSFSKHENVPMKQTCWLSC